MKFLNNDAKVNVTLSDIYVGGKMLMRVQAERTFNTVMLQRTVNDSTPRKSEKDAEEVAPPDCRVLPNSQPPDRRSLLDSQKMIRRRSILTIQTDDGGKEYIVVPKKVLSPDNADDVETLRNAAHYSNYADYAYSHIHTALVDLLPKDATKFIRDFNAMSPMPCFSLEYCGVPYAQLYYINFYNGITATPYSILVDEKEKSVVITVRGSASLEGE